MEETLKIDYSLIFENMTAGMCIVEVLPNKGRVIHDYIVVEVNSRFELMFNTCKDDILGESIFSMCPDVKEECRQALKDVYNTGRSERLEIYRSDIEKYLVVKMFKTQGGYVVLLLTDVTKQRKAEETLIKSEESFKTLYENVAGGVIIVDEDYIIRDVNWRTCEITGYSKDELVGQLCDKICPKGMSSNKCPIWAEKKSGFVGMDTLIKCNGDRHIPIIKDAKRLTIGGKSCIFENFHDITEQKKAESQLHIAKEKAEESNRLKTAFLANVSHEIRTPMNGILGFADLLSEPDLSGDTQKEYLEVIQRSGKRMLNIINELIDISKIESGQIDLFYKKVNVRELLEEQFQFFNPDAEKKGINLICKEGIEKDLLIHSDPIRLSQILCNLLNNAMKYTKYGQIEFGCRVENDFCVFYVRDTGVGIVKELQKKIFERFSQGDLYMTKSYEGVGLGLSISKGYLDRMGGKIWVKSSPGEGSTFYFTIPL